ncbi:MAG: lipopolysaccharide biosynthesis protein [Pirellulales bacterium]|nr:lipopolysaccharide biosynthesis protein [Pirellulales bacterium]
MRVVDHLKQLAGESVVYGLSGTATKLIALLLIPLYTRVFTAAEVGVMGLIDVTINLAAIVAVLGLDGASARWFYDTEETDDRRATISSAFWCQLAASVLLAGLLIAVAGPLAEVIGGETDCTALIWLAALTLPLLTITRVMGSLFRFQRRPWATMATTLGYSLSRVGLILVLVLVWHFRLDGVYWARLAAISGLAVVATIILWQWIRPANISRERLREMVRFGLPLVPAGVGLWIMTSIDRYFLVLMRDQTEVGLYDLAARLAAGAALAVVAFQQAWGPFAYSIHGKDEADRVYAGVLDVYGYFGCFVASAVALFAPLVLRVMATEKFYTAASCLAPLVFVYFLAGARFIASLGSGIAKRSTPIAWSVGVGVTVNVGLNLVFIPRWGREGAAAASVLAAAAGTVYMFVASQRLHQLPYRWRTSLVSLALAWLLIGVATWWVPEVTLGGLAIRAAMLLTFVPLGIALGVLHRRHLRQLFRRA